MNCRSGSVKSPIPFKALFREVSPEKFVVIFNSEFAQTKAFILSFSPGKSYVRKVLRLLDTQESAEKDLTKRSSFIIRDYLRRCREEPLNTDFVHSVELEINSMIADRGSFYLYGLRKDFLARLEELK